MAENMEYIPFVDNQISERFVGRRVFLPGVVTGVCGDQYNIQTHTGVMRAGQCGQLAEKSNVLIEGLITQPGFIMAESVSTFEKPWDFQQVDTMIKLSQQDFRSLFTS
eukprot:TRINITY_DN54297_c0_g1_i4.p3 TRINITY_DN54297_c0_g1~~TRINITY_DN54297_c0_g1_i4.p3  ORF type:complete len:124 (-),score=6.10 TRINITY_DN54297_c0_g1_i4:249-572(-)